MNDEIIEKAKGEVRRNYETEIYKGLMEAVFKKSLESLRDFEPRSPESLNGNGISYSGRERLARRSWRWLEAEDHEHPFSFVSICDFFGYDSKKIREMTYDLLRNSCNLDYFLNGTNKKEKVA